MASRNILAIGTSAGGVEALRGLVREIPSDFEASILITIHLASQYPSVMDAILSNAGPLPARFATEGESLERGCIYLAPPGRHLLVQGHRLHLGAGPLENHARPAIDPMFRSTAACCGARSIGVVLTGALGDGAFGLWALKQCGGVTVVQDPNDATYPEMPATAISLATPDHIVSLAELPRLVVNLVRQRPGRTKPASKWLEYEVRIARGEAGGAKAIERVGRDSALTCPDCGGVMWEIAEGELFRYRCHVGHGYTAEAMSDALDENLAHALATAVHALEERIELAQKLRQRAIENDTSRLAEHWAEKSRECEQEAKLIRQTIARIDEIPAQAAQAASSEEGKRDGIP